MVGVERENFENLEPLDCRKRPTVYVCNDLAQELLLGADFLKTKNCVADFSANVLVVKGQRIPMTYRSGPFACHV
jgi:hypothetical protein